MEAYAAGNLQQEGNPACYWNIWAAAWDTPIRTLLSTAQHPDISSSRLKGGSQLFKRCFEITFWWLQMDESDF